MRRRRLGVWPSLPPGAYLRPAFETLPYPLDQPNHRRYERARHALWHGCRALGLGPGDQVLVPAYHHGSEVEALLQAGLDVRFVDVTEQIEPDEAALERAIGPRTKALYLIHVLGFPQDTRRWRRWCDERGLLLLEDAAQAWLARDGDTPLGTVGDLAIFCMYKTVGIPDGAALICATPPEPPSATGDRGVFEVLKRHGAWASERSALGAAVLTPLSEFVKTRGERGVDLVHREFELGDPDSPPSAASEWLLPRLADPAIPEIRRRHFLILQDALREFVPTGFSDMPTGASPFAFPFESDLGEALADDLFDEGVKALLLWKNPHPSLAVDDFPVATRLRRRVLALSVHQELTTGEVYRIADIVRHLID